MKNKNRYRFISLFILWALAYALIMPSLAQPTKSRQEFIDSITYDNMQPSRLYYWQLFDKTPKEVIKIAVPDWKLREIAKNHIIIGQSDGYAGSNLTLQLNSDNRVQSIEDSYFCCFGNGTRVYKSKVQSLKEDLERLNTGIKESIKDQSYYYLQNELIDRACIYKEMGRKDLALKDLAMLKTVKIKPRKIK